jgi:hypothetical protein
LHFLLPDRLAIHRLQTIKRLWKKKARDVSYVHASAVFIPFTKFISSAINNEKMS